MALTLVVASIVLVTNASVPPATTYFSPYRTITAHEMLLNSCELSDAIVVVRIDRTFDDFYRDKQAREEVGDMGWIAECTVFRVLKGDVQAGGQLRVQLTNQPGIPETKNPCGVMMLCRSRVDFKRWAKGAHGPLPVWVRNAGPYQFQFGFAPGECAGGSKTEAQVQSALRQSEPEQLAAQSDIVVIATVGNKYASCPVDEQVRACAVLADFEQIYGPRQSGDIRVVASIPGYVQPGRQVLYLKRILPDTFEIMGLSAGAQRIVGNQVGHDKRPLNEVILRVTKAEAARLGREKMSR